VPLLRFLEAIENCLKKRSVRNLLPVQPGDVTETSSDVEPLAQLTSFHPNTPIEEGIRRTIEWYLLYRPSNAEF
jgi:UDP-glucuronate 4-epimerase